VLYLLSLQSFIALPQREARRSVLSASAAVLYRFPTGRRIVLVAFPRVCSAFGRVSSASPAKRPSSLPLPVGEGWGEGNFVSSGYDRHVYEEQGEVVNGYMLCFIIPVSRIPGQLNGYGISDLKSDSSVTKKRLLLYRLGKGGVGGCLRPPQVCDEWLGIWRLKTVPCHGQHHRARPGTGGGGDGSFVSFPRPGTHHETERVVDPARCMPRGPLIVLRLRKRDHASKPLVEGFQRIRLHPVTFRESLCGVARSQANHMPVHREAQGLAVLSLRSHLRHAQAPPPSTRLRPVVPRGRRALGYLE